MVGSFFCGRGAVGIDARWACWPLTVPTKVRVWPADALLMASPCRHSTRSGLPIRKGLSRGACLWAWRAPGGRSMRVPVVREARWDASSRSRGGGEKTGCMQGRACTRSSSRGAVLFDEVSTGSLRSTIRRQGWLSSGPGRHREIVGLRLCVRTCVRNERIEAAGSCAYRVDSIVYGCAEAGDLIALMLFAIDDLWRVACGV